MKSKTRRKLTFRRFAYYLLIAAIVVSCVTNGIFAKFTTEDDGGDGARVAKFGLKLSVAGDLFSTTYNAYAEDEGVETEDSNLPAAWVETISDDDTISVQATAKYVLDGEGNATDVLDNVVAPGTKNDTGICIDIQGNAETDCEVLFDIYYKPIFLNTDNVSYGLMVEINKAVINEANWEEMVAEGLYYISTTDGENTEYVDVKANETYASKYDSTDKFFKLTNFVSERIENDNGFYYPVTLKIKKTTDDGEGNTEEVEVSSEGIGPSRFFSGYMGGQIGKVFNYFIPFDANEYYARMETDPEYVNTNTHVDSQYYFTWNWDFEDEYDAYDTILGYIAAGEEVVKRVNDVYTTNLTEGVDYCLNFEFTANATINQVD